MSAILILWLHCRQTCYREFLRDDRPPDDAAEWAIQNCTRLCDEKYKMTWAEFSKDQKK